MQCSGCDVEMRYIVRARAWYCPGCDIYLDEEDIGVECDALAAKNAELRSDIVRWRRAVQTVEMERNTLSDENTRLRAVLAHFAAKWGESLEDWLLEYDRWCEGRGGER